MSTEERTPLIYQALWDAYYQQNGRVNHKKAAKKARCSVETATLAYVDGWEGLGWAIPIRDRIRTPMAEVRRNIEVTEEIIQRLLADPDVVAKLREEIRKEAYVVAVAELENLQESEAQVKEKIRLNAQKTREEELDFASLMRMRAKVAMVGVGQAQKEFARMGETLERRFKMYNDMTDTQLSTIDPHEILSLITRYMDVQLQLGQLMQTAQAIDRKAAGDADVVVEHRGEMTREEAERILSNAANLDYSTPAIHPNHEPN